MRWLDIEGWLTEPEGEYLAHVGAMLPQGAHCVEVGTFLGRSAAAFLSRAPHLDMLCIDTFDGRATSKANPLPPLLNMKRMEEEVARVIGRGAALPVMSTSLEAAKRLEDADLDYLFLDADHSYEAVLADLRAWWPKMKPGATLYGHDYHESWPSVVEAVCDFFKKEGRNVELHCETIWGVRK